MVVMGLKVIRALMEYQAPLGGQGTPGPLVGLGLQELRASRDPRVRLAILELQGSLGL